MLLHLTPEHEPMPTSLVESRKLQPTVQRQDWQSLNYFSLTFVEQRIGISICPADFIPVDNADDCEAAAYHLRRSFTSYGGPECNVYVESIPPTVIFGKKKNRPDGIKGQSQLVCQMVSPPAGSQAFIGYHRVKKNEYWASRPKPVPAVESPKKERQEPKKEKKKEDKKKKKQKTTRDPNKPKPLEKKWHLLEFADGQTDPKYEYIGHGWCTNKRGRRIKLRRTHWMSHPGNRDFSVPFCEKLCLESGAPICVGYVVNISFGRVKTFQCDIINVLDDNYDDGIEGIFEDDAAERHCWRLKDYPKFESREDAIMASPPRQAPDQRAEGILLAKHFNAHCRHLWGPKHWTDSIASDERNTLYVTNVKAGSMSIRQKFFILRAGFFTSPLPVANSDARYQCNRMSTGVWNSEDIYKNDMTIFSWVRDPVKKFESGVRQAWFHDGSLTNITADDMLDMVLGDGTLPKYSEPVKNCGKTHNLEYGWVNEHLQPSSWRITGETNDRKHLQMTFIGKLEHMNRDWNELLTRVLIDKEEEYLIPLLEEKMWVKNAREKDPRSILSKESIRKMCKSERYKREWACFQYDPPPECADIDLSLETVLNS